MLLHSQLKTYITLEKIMIELEKLPTGGLWIPAEDTTSKWLVIALHGSGGSSKDFVGLEDIFKIGGELLWHNVCLIIQYCSLRRTVGTAVEEQGTAYSHCRDYDGYYYCSD